jgi:hypothetical protein
MLLLIIGGCPRGLLLKQVSMNNWLNFWHFRVKQWGGFMVHVTMRK